MLPLNKIINNKINILGRQDYLKAVNNRYGGKFGNLKYLKDYIFGFSNPTRNS